MRTRQLKIRDVFIPMACIAVMSYFAYHAVHGDHGLHASRILQETLDGLEAERARLAGIRGELEHKVALMRPESLDPDMLGEQARLRLNLAHPNDIAVFRDPGQ